MRRMLPSRVRVAPSAPPQAAAALALLAVLLMLRVPSLGAPLGIDEGGMTLIGADWLRDLFAGTPGTSLYGDHWIDRPPLILGLYGSAQLLAGELGVRLLGLLCALAAACLTGTVASRLSTPRAWLPAALVGGALLSAPALDGDRTAGELLAAVPSSLAVALIALVALADHQQRAGGAAWSARRRDLALVFAGGAAVAAPLIKQSALDALVAATLWLAWRAWRDLRRTGRRARFLRDVACMGIGGSATAALTFALAMRGGASVDDLTYALLGFRVDVLAALGAQSQSAAERFPRLLEPAALSGLLLAACLAPAGIELARRGRAGTAGAVIMGGWALGATIGVLGGGYYWAHYLLQVAAPVGGAAGIALARLRLRFTVALLAVLVASALTGQAIRAADVTPRRLVEAGYQPQTQDDVVAVADFVRRNSSSEDRVAVLYARANIAYHARREPATAYLWSSMFRAIPDARADLLASLTGPGRAEWVVSWERVAKYGMDADGAVSRALRSGYRDVAMLCGKPVLLRSDRVLRSVVVPPARCSTAGPPRIHGDVVVTRGFARS